MAANAADFIGDTNTPLYFVVVPMGTNSTALLWAVDPTTEGFTVVSNWMGWQSQNANWTNVYQVLTNGMSVTQSVVCFSGSVSNLLAFTNVYQMGRLVASGPFAGSGHGPSLILPGGGYLIQPSGGSLLLP